MDVLVTGATGLVGTQLVGRLRAEGHRVRRLVRKASETADDIPWNPDAGTIVAETLEGMGAVVHLAGENIASGRWTPERKQRIRASRVRGTTLIAKALARLRHPPRVLVGASAVGYYGDRGEQLLDESSGPGSGFLPDVCREWEAATWGAAQPGIRVVSLRIGIVLSPLGGALQRMLAPFRLGLGGVLGSGSQYWSWITLDDLIGVIRFAIDREALFGPVNAVAPAPATNREFTRALARALGRPAPFRVPGFAVRWVFGEMANELLLASARVSAAKLVAAGYTFRHPELEPALRALLDRTAG